MYAGHDQAILQLLADTRRLDPAALASADATRQATGRTLAEVLVEMGLLGTPGLLAAIAAAAGWEWTAELPAELPPGIVALVDAPLARSHQVVPLAADERGISVAVGDPFHPHLAGDLGFALGGPVRLVVADPARVQRLVDQHYAGNDPALAAVVGSVAEAAPESLEAAALTDDDLAQQAGQARVVRFVNAVLAQAIRDQASDIHFEPFDRELRVRCRVDGALRDLGPPPAALALAVISRLKVLANVNIAERRMPQDGRIRLALGDRPVDLRLSTLPTQFGESVVLRVLDQSAGRLDWGELGLPADVREGLEAALRRPHGLVIVTGPTGSGKTSTLYGGLRRLNATGTKILTVEDPVEYEVEGLLQVPVNLAAGLTFERALRAFLRQDPDVIMVGEIRDGETAQMAVQASLTGHLVLTTLHTNDAASAVTRLLDLGVEPFLLASTVGAVIAQRLLRRLCPDCREPFPPDAALLRQLDLAPDATGGRPFFRGRGCAACRQSGYRGRAALFEFLPVSEAFRELVARGAALADLKQRAGADGLVSLRAAGLAAILAGVTTADEVLRYT